MKMIKKIVRILVLTCIMILAVVGMPAIFPNYKDEYQHKKVRREVVDEEDSERE
jgi:hypothetical protein